MRRKKQDAKVPKVDKPNDWGVRAGEFHASTTEPKLRSRRGGQIRILEIQKSLSIEELRTFSIQGSTSWTTLILSYLKDGQLPLDLKEARKIKRQATRFTILNDVFYKRGLSLPYLRCVEQDKARYILEEVCGGVRGDHLGAKSLVGKIVKVGYFWPTMQKEAK